MSGREFFTLLVAFSVSLSFGQLKWENTTANKGEWISATPTATYVCAALMMLLVLTCLWGRPQGEKLLEEYDDEEAAVRAIVAALERVERADECTRLASCWPWGPAAPYGPRGSQLELAVRLAHQKPRVTDLVIEKREVHKVAIEFCAIREDLQELLGMTMEETPAVKLGPSQLTWAVASHTSASDFSLNLKKDRTPTDASHTSASDFENVVDLDREHTPSVEELAYAIVHREETPDDLVCPCGSLKCPKNAVLENASNSDYLICPCESLECPQNAIPNKSLNSDESEKQETLVYVTSQRSVRFAEGTRGGSQTLSEHNAASEQTNSDTPSDESQQSPCPVHSFGASLKKRPSARSLELSRESDVLHEAAGYSQDPCTCPPSKTQSPRLVRVGSTTGEQLADESQPQQVQVVRLLSRFSSFNPDDEKDAIPKDPLTVPQSWIPIQEQAAFSQSRTSLGGRTSVLAETLSEMGATEASTSRRPHRHDIEVLSTEGGTTRRDASPKKKLSDTAKDVKERIMRGSESRTQISRSNVSPVGQSKTTRNTSAKTTTLSSPSSQKKVQTRDVSASEQTPDIQKVGAGTFVKQYMNKSEKSNKNQNSAIVLHINISDNTVTSKIDKISKYSNKEERASKSPPTDLFRDEKLESLGSATGLDTEISNTDWDLLYNFPSPSPSDNSDKRQQTRSASESSKVQPMSTSSSFVKEVDFIRDAVSYEICNIESDETPPAGTSYQLSDSLAREQGDMEVLYRRMDEELLEESVSTTTPGASSSMSYKEDSYPEIAQMKENIEESKYRGLRPIQHTKYVQETVPVYQRESTSELQIPVSPLDATRYCQYEEDHSTVPDPTSQTLHWKLTINPRRDKASNSTMPKRGQQLKKT